MELISLTYIILIDVLQVKKKNNQGIGPFDCTKYTNIPSSSSQ